MPTAEVDEPASVVRRTKMRLVWVSIHRWLGLVLGGWLSVIGVTGALLVFQVEIDARLNPELLRVAPPSPIATFRQPAEIMAVAVGAMPAGAAMGFSTFPPDAESAYVIGFTVPDDVEGAGDWHVYVDPYTAEVLGKRCDKAAADWFPRYFVPFVFSLHYGLLLPISIGAPVVGCVTVALLLSLMTGVVLWWPRTGKWRRAMTIKGAASPQRLIFDLHKVGSLYALPVLATLFISGLSLNLPETFRTAVRLFSPGTQASRPEVPGRTSGRFPTSIAEAMAIADRHTPGGRYSWLIPASAADPVHTVCKDDLHQLNRFIDSRCLLIAADGGDILHIADAVSGTNGDAFLAWQQPLHSGHAFGWIGRMLVFLGGLATPLLFITGTIRFLHKRSARRAPKARCDSTDAREAIAANPLLADVARSVSPLGSGALRESRNPINYVAAFMISASLHAGLGTWLFVRLQGPAGFEGNVIDAINIDMVDGTALESVDARQRAEQAGAHEAVASKPGLDVPVEVAELAASQPAAVKTDVEGARPNEAVATLPSRPEGEIEAAPIVKPDPAKETEPQPRPERDRTEPKPERKKAETDNNAVLQLPQEAKVKGGAASTAAVEAEAAPSASTSPGERSRYAMLVREALGPTRPRHDGMKGSVFVAFALSPTGAVRSVDVAKSSGSTTLDRAAIAAVQRTTFPPPPAGMSDGQRSYMVSFDFK